MKKSAVFLFLLGYAASATAVQFTGSHTAPNTWTYTLTYDPEDNYSVCQLSTTITVNGLSGVTAAGAPTSTDISDPRGAAVNLLWTPQVLNNGTTVVWTIGRYGTGNSSTAEHVYGFTITGAGAPGTASFSTNGFASDTGCPATSLDISGTVPGPVASATPSPQPASAPALGITTICLLIVAVMGWGWLRAMRSPRLPMANAAVRPDSRAASGDEKRRP